MRLSFALERDQLPSIPQKRFIIGFRFTNAFSPQAVGKIELKGPPGWKVENAEHVFNLGSGEVFSERFALTLPLQIVGDIHDVSAEITLTAPNRRKFEIRRLIRVGDDGAAVPPVRGIGRATGHSTCFSPPGTNFPGRRDSTASCMLQDAVP